MFDSVWDGMDVDGGGELDREEMEGFGALVGVELTEEQLDDLFWEIDVDGGGEVDYSEFNDWIRGGTAIANLVKGELVKAVTGQETLLQAEMKRRISSKDAMKMLVKELFELVDKDGDGDLTKEELMRLPALAGCDWTPVQKTKAASEILGMSGRSCDAKKFGRWLQNADNQMATQLLGQSKLCITYRAAGKSHVAPHAWLRVRLFVCVLRAPNCLLSITYRTAKFH